MKELSIVLGIILTVFYNSDVTINEMLSINFMLESVWELIKFIITSTILNGTIIFSIPAIIIDFIFEINMLDSMWLWSWNTVAVDWFWHATKLIKLFFSFILIMIIGVIRGEY